MAKSQETWNKKEREKQKQKDKKDKAEKKQARKDGATGSKSLNDMMAYVDENGNITDTPPDPSKRRMVNIEDIVIGVPKQLPPDPSEQFRTGVVTFFNGAKGYGFIRDLKTQESIFVHINAVIDPITENSKVSFEIEMGPKGPSAVKVKKAL